MSLGDNERTKNMTTNEQNGSQGVNSGADKSPHENLSQPAPSSAGQTTPMQANANTVPTASAPQESSQQENAQQSYAHHAPAHQAPSVQSTAHYSAYSTSASSKKASSSSKTFLFGFLGAALACILALVGFGIFNSQNNSGGNTGSGTSLGASTDTQIITAEEDETRAEVVAEKALPSVVSVEVYTAQRSQGFGALFGYGQNSDSGSSELVQSSLGSGVVLSEDGYIITNYHVIEGSQQLLVTIEGEEYEAEVVGTDESSDLAVIKAKDASGLTAIEIGDSTELKTGQWVMALGSPFGLEQSASVGIVSAVSRSTIMQSTTGVSLYTNLIQTDAAINQGNSGGALVDANGKLIGINTLITSTSGDFSGIGFAIPINYAIGIAEDLIEGKTPSHSQLGVSLTSVTSDLAQRYDLPVSKGAYVSQIVSGSAAEKAGIEEGDIITKFNGADIESANDLMLAVRSISPGDKAQVEFNRDGEAKSVEVTMGSDTTQ